MALTDNQVVWVALAALVQMATQVLSREVKAQSAHNNLPMVLKVELAGLEEKVATVQMA
jgi:hypothetical protein